MRRTTWLWALILTAVVVPAQADPPTSQPSADAQTLIDRGLAYLKSQQQPDGGWLPTGTEPPAITALVLKAFVQAPGYSSHTPLVQKGYAELLTFQKPEGGIYRDVVANYNTAIAISSLAAAHDPAYQPAEQKALAYLRRLQWTDTVDQVTERQRVGSTDPRYGGFGYGKRQRPDGSNLQIALDALHDAGVKPTDPAYQAAVAFASRLQNRSESNDQPWAGDDGGFIYTDANGGDSPAGSTTRPTGQKMFRSYGSMTYAMLKSMIYAGLSKNDPRVVAGMNWIRHNYTFDTNPGIQYGPGNVSESGLYYYFHTAARFLHAYGEPTLTDASGTVHDWRAELTTKLASLQKPDGSWVGQTKWMENNPILATAFAVLTLEEVQNSSEPNP